MAHRFRVSRVRSSNVIVVILDLLNLGPPFPWLQIQIRSFRTNYASMSCQYQNPAAELERLLHREVSFSDCFLRFTRRGQRQLLPPHLSVETSTDSNQLVSATSLSQTGERSATPLSQVCFHAYTRLAASNLMPGFQAINHSRQIQKLPTPLLPDNGASDSEEELPDPCTFIRPRAEPTSHHTPTFEEPENICGRHWPMKAIIDKRIVWTHPPKVEFHIEWRPSVLLEKDIRRRQDGCSYVRCDGNDFNISEDSPATPSEDGRLQRLVVWKNTWRSYEDLVYDHENMWDLMQEYDLEQGDKSDPEPDSNETSFRTKRDVNYSRYVRRRIRDKCNEEGIAMKPKQRSLVNTGPKRPLIFRDGKEMSLVKEEKTNAMLIYDTGDEQPEPCDRCQRDVGPFPKCVVHEKFNNGACASCIYARSGPKCNFSRSGQFPNQLPTAPLTTLQPDPLPPDLSALG